MFGRKPYNAKPGEMTNPAVGNLAATRKGGPAQIDTNAKTCVVCTVVHVSAAAATACEDGKCDQHACGKS